MLTNEKHEAALFISDASAQRAATALTFRGFLSAIAREYANAGTDTGFRVVAFHADRTFAGFVAE
jgi:hypothetical protein